MISATAGECHRMSNCLLRSMLLKTERPTYDLRCDSARICSKPPLSAFSVSACSRSLEEANGPYGKKVPKTLAELALLDMSSAEPPSNYGTSDCVVPLRLKVCDCAFPSCSSDPHPLSRLRNCHVLRNIREYNAILPYHWQRISLMVRKILHPRIERERLFEGARADNTSSGLTKVRTWLWCSQRLHNFFFVGRALICVAALSCIVSLGGTVYRDLFQIIPSDLSFSDESGMGQQENSSPVQLLNDEGRWNDLASSHVSSETITGLSNLLKHVLAE